MIHSLFPTYIYQSKLTNKPVAKLNKDLKKEAYQFKKIDELGQEWCKKNYPGGYTSYGSMSELHKVSSSFEDLEKMLRLHVYKFARALEMDINPKELKISSLWINIMPKNVTHSMHIHPLSVVSGTYYVQTPKKTSSIKFEDPRMDQFMATPPRKAAAKKDNQRFVSIEPQAGQIVLFESWARHEVPPNQSNEDRISISFNYDWK